MPKMYQRERERERETEHNVEGCVLQLGDFVTKNVPAHCTVLLARAERAPWEI